MFTVQVLIAYETDTVEGVKEEVESWGIPEGAQVSVSAQVPNLLIGVRGGDGKVALPPPPELPEPGPPPELDPIEPE
jgi:hypothetical protein